MASNSRHNKQNLPQLNVLLMIADDLGIGDLSCYGNKNIKTPNIDLLASEGIKFNRMYSFPSDSGGMAAILTGQQPSKFGLVKSNNQTRDDFWSPAQQGAQLHLGAKNLGRVFSVNNMNSFFNGKWGLGFQPDTIPTSNGFLSFYGTLMAHSVGCTKENRYSDTSFFWQIMAGYLPIFSSLAVMIIISYYFSRIRFRTFVLMMFILLLGIASLRTYCWMSLYNPNACILMENNVIKEQPYNEDNVSLRLIKNAVHFFKYRAKNNVPFLYVMSFLQPKFPHLRSSEFKNKTKSSYYDSILELDWSVGKILKTLEKNNLKNNTLVIFVSDNAPSFNHPVTKLPLTPKHQKSNTFTANKIVTKLRGEKGSNMEGGLRVPAIMRLPGTIPENAESNVVSSLMDIYPTILDYYNFERTVHDRAIDGKSLYPVFKDPNLSPSSSPHDQLYHFCDLGPVGAVTVGNLKVLFRKSTETDCSGPLLDNPLIFNVSSDPEELHPLPINAHMPLLYHIKASLKKYELKANLRQMKHSQFDKMPNPFNFPCNDILDCTKTYDEDGSFDALFQE